MSKASVLQTLDPQKVTQAVTNALPKVEILADAKNREERLSKAIRAFGDERLRELGSRTLAYGSRARAWWRKLPNDGVRIAIPVGASLLVAGVITGLVVGYARRH